MIKETWKFKSRNIYLATNFSSLFFPLLLIIFSDICHIFQCISKGKYQKERERGLYSWKRVKRFWENFSKILRVRLKACFYSCRMHSAQQYYQPTTTKTINVRKFAGERMRREEKKFFMQSSDFSCCVCFIRVSIFDWDGTIYYRMKEKLIIVVIGP